MSAPVRHTCPDIDKVIKCIKQAQKAADNGKDKSQSDTDEYGLFDEILDNLYRLEDRLEELRSSNDELRSWGEDLEKDLRLSEDKIYELEVELETSLKTA